MANEGEEQQPVSAFFDPFHAAEEACEEALDAILTEGGRLLYESYIEKKSFSFAADTVTHLLVSELKLCFVRYDRGEPGEPKEEERDTRPARDGWALEPEPARCRIDTWARSCVPIRRKFVPQQVAPAALDTTPKRRARNLKGSTASNASVGRPAATVALDQSDRKPSIPEAGRQQQMIPLVEEYESDPEEDSLREMKEREARRKREEDQRVQRKAAEEAEEQSRLKQVKEQAKSKPFTYDTSGSVIWVQPLKAHKMPITTPAPTFNLRRDPGEASTKRPPLPRSQSSRKPPKRVVEFPDTFEKFSAEQPSMMEAMSMAPGVELTEKGQRKLGTSPPVSARARQPMTRRDYEDMVSRGGELRREESPRAPSAPPAAPSPEPAEPVEPARRSSSAELVPHPPSSPRPVQPAAPSMFRREQMKRTALGQAASSRERASKGGASRFPNCAAQPPLGATMGHGLAPVGQKQEEYFYPAAASAARDAGASTEVRRNANLRSTHSSGG